MATQYKGVRGGTISGTPLCPTCRHAQYIQGLSLSQRILFCDRIGKRMEFEAQECSQYDDKRLPSKWDMEEIAWVFVTNHKNKQIGFVSAKEFRQIQQQSEPDEPSATPGFVK